MVRLNCGKPEWVEKMECRCNKGFALQFKTPLTKTARPIVILASIISHVAVSALGVLAIFGLIPSTVLGAAALGAGAITFFGSAACGEPHILSVISLFYMTIIGSLILSGTMTAIRGGWALSGPAMGISGLLVLGACLLPVGGFCAYKCAQR